MRDARIKKDLQPFQTQDRQVQIWGDKTLLERKQITCILFLPQATVELYRVDYPVVLLEN